MEDKDVELNSVIGNFTKEEVIFYVAIVFVGALAGACRALRDESYQSAGNFCGLCGTAGFLSLFCVAFLARFWVGVSGSEFFHLGVSSFIGLLGKETDLLIRWILKTALEKFGVKADEL